MEMDPCGRATCQVASKKHAAGPGARGWIWNTASPAACTYRIFTVFGSAGSWVRLRVRVVVNVKAATVTGHGDGRQPPLGIGPERLHRVVHCQAGDLMVVANVGDSRVVLGTASNDGVITLSSSSSI
uniref:Uncharacterized protein n=1 Tax=Zea mays TaxID=4577 RepID=A0A804M5S0_MAIZE